MRDDDLSQFEASGQVPALVDAECSAVLVDSRGHGRSTRDSRPYSYELLAADVLQHGSEWH